MQFRIYTLHTCFLLDRAAIFNLRYDGALLAFPFIFFITVSYVTTTTRYRGQLTVIDCHKIMAHAQDK